MTASDRAYPHTAVVPGRVNLIGEHIDYNGLPVLPIALDRKVRIDFRATRDPVVRLGNTSERFAPFEFRLDRPIGAAAQGDWSNYVRAAARGLLAHGVEPGCGIEGTVAGDVPIAAGLSSSSALVVASALALLRANGVEVVANEGEPAGQVAAVFGPRAGAFVSDGRDESAAPEDHTGESITRIELAALMARAERFVGLEGGGMDQAACLCGVAGHALRIEFDPLRVTPVAVPEGWRWVVASSLARAEKSAGARESFNERARQCREAVGGLGEGVAMRGGAATAMRERGGFAGDGLRAAGGRASAREVRLIRGESAAIARTGGGAADSALTYQDLVQVDDVQGLLRHARRVLPSVLFRRLRHVVTEGRRVMLAEDALRNGDIGCFGALMVRSHESLRDDYEVSTAELDAIVAVALEAGAAGARLTGAGFGGCAVVLCDEATVSAVMEALAAGCYEPRLGRRPTGEEMFGVGVGC